MKTQGVNVLVKGRKDDKYGYLKISIRKNGKTAIYSLGIKVLKKDFNPRMQLMRASAPDADKINEFIETKLDSFSYKPYKAGKIKSICVFMQKTIDTTIVKSTKQKYENILTLFIEYLNLEYKRTDLFFEEIDGFVIGGFHNYLLTKERKNTANTANYKMKSFKSFFSKIKGQGIYYWSVDPFVSVKYKFEETKKDWLSFNEFKKLIERDFKDTRIRKSIIKYSLNEIKEAFIFSTLAQGLRISDIMTLRWNDFDTNAYTESDALIIKKKMIKTKKIVYIFLDNFSSQFLLNSIFKIVKDNSQKRILEQLNMSISDKKKVQDRINELKSNDFFDGDIGGEWNENGLKPSSSGRNILGVQKQNANNDYFDNYIASGNLVQLKEDLERANYEIFSNIKKLVEFLSNDLYYKTKFVFPFLENHLFLDIDEMNDFSQITEKQYLQFQGRRSYINRLLKELVLKPIVPNKKLSFHSARHTYTSLILEKDKVGINLYDLMKSLGHTSILSTEKYIKGFNYKKISQINASLNESLVSD